MAAFHPIAGPQPAVPICMAFRRPDHTWQGIARVGFDEFRSPSLVPNFAALRALAPHGCSERTAPAPETPYAIDAGTPSAYAAFMVFIESAVFTRQVQEVLSDEGYAQLQEHLARNPRAGSVIQDTGGLRKVRWSVAGAGKRGGVRVIYFHAVAQTQIRLLLIYAKGVKDDLNAAEKKTLRKLNQDW